VRYRVLACLLQQANERRAQQNFNASQYAPGDLLSDEQAQALLVELSRFPEVVEAAAVTLEPHAVAQYLRELANAFHVWYHAQPILVDDANQRDARLALSVGTGQVLKNGLDLLGVSAPEKM